MVDLTVKGYTCSDLTVTLSALPLQAVASMALIGQRRFQIACSDHMGLDR
ncbi:hypothetical protein QTH89_13210 [Variovorax sp. J22G21]|nr:hypothetical protein [Variovorax sp. J22R193]MDM0037388.1 hypothetical protein [Variovorax sp. J22R193]MDM0062165.1 hypothetical protein [Variovorax sp. J22G21]